MTEHDHHGKEEIYSKILRAGRRTYFFDVRATKADDFYLTITESKKHENNNGDSYYKKHKIYLYKEDFDRFRELLHETTDYIINEKGEEVISERHNPDFKKKNDVEDIVKETTKGADAEEEKSEESSKAFTDVNFEEF
jgi:hypothetical protein